MSQAALDPRRRASTDIEIGGRPKLDSSASASHHYKIEGHGLKPDTVRPTIRIANIPKELEIPRVNLRFLGQVLGKGNFGKVEKAILLREGTENVVAVKMIKGIFHSKVFWCFRWRIRNYHTNHNSFWIFDWKTRFVFYFVRLYSKNWNYPPNTIKAVLLKRL